MKKIIVIAIILFSVPIISFQQVSIVTAPKLEAETAKMLEEQTFQTKIMGSMDFAIAGLQEADRLYKEALKQATWLKNLQTATRLIYMMENLVCTTRTLTANMQYARGNASCLSQFRYDIATSQLQMCVDYMGLLITEGISMSISERAQLLSITHAKFEDAQNKLVDLNEELEARHIEQQIEQAIYQDMLKFQGIQ